MISAHVAAFVPPDVRGADVHHVGALFHRLLPHRHDPFPVLLCQQIAEQLAAVGVRPFADEDGGRVEMQRGRLVQTGGAGNEFRRSRPGARPPTDATSWRMCSGVVPQHPPTTLTPRSFTKWVRNLVNSSGVSL